MNRLLVLVAALFTGMAAYAQQEKTMTVNYLALGDSYTIGEKVERNKNWPNQLAQRLNAKGYAIAEPRIIAVTGWTTDELIEGIAKSDLGSEARFDLVSLLIGVNNQYRGYPIEQYKKEFRQLLQQAIAFAGGDATKVFVVAIPDYGVTPLGQGKDPEKIDRELRQYNQIARDMAAEYGIPFADTYAASKQALGQPTLTASDDLHPSAQMYSLWTDVIEPVAEALVKAQQ